MHHNKTVSVKAGTVLMHHAMTQWRLIRGRN